MNKTGTYIFDETEKKVVKVSDEIPTIPKGIWFPKGGHRYFDKALNKKFYSKTEKRDYIKHNGLYELPQVESDKHRYERCAVTINDDRNKKGLKSKTVSELRGGVK